MYMQRCEICKGAKRTVTSQPLKCQRCTAIYSKWVGGEKIGYQGYPRAMRVKRIVGIVTDHVCDPRCTSAIGSKCECSCGGANHGMAYA